MEWCETDLCSVGGVVGSCVGAGVGADLLGEWYLLVLGGGL